ncbi:MAG: T9SS type A sorting domain-containing protein [Muribaculaceae bacterium]|nr:T9SS type A sorting domain-containing protein [Muribaculaceae bacterium]
MKKSLLWGAMALLGAASAQALPTAPSMYANQYITCISPDGRYTGSEMYACVFINDLLTGQTYEYYGDDMYQGYGTGSGNCWSATGIMVGCTKYNGDPAYWENGEWHLLPNPQNRAVFMRAITPDGNVALGVARTIKADNVHSELFDIPILWTRNADGSWADPEILPFPTTDFTGRAPQGLFPISISDDGTKIACHLRDYSGFFPSPMMLVKGTDGKWSYTEWGGKFINKKDRTFPFWDEDNPPVDPMSHAQDYISDEEDRTSYIMDYEDWLSDMQGFQYPEATDYMSAADLAKFNEDVEKYQDEAAKWNADLEKFFEAFSYVAEESDVVTFNNAFITPDGSVVASTATTKYWPDPADDSYFLEESGPIWIYSDHFERCEGVDGYTASAIAADGSMLVSAGSNPRIVRKGREPQDLYKFMQDNSDEATNDWLYENVCHTFDMVTESGYTYSYVDQPMLGVACCTPDLSVIAFNALNSWDYNDPVEYYSYVVPTPNASLGVKAVNAAESTLTVKAAKGVIEVNEPANIEVFDLQGRLVFKAEANGAVSTDLNNGIYTVRASNAAGSKVVKAMF